MEWKDYEQLILSEWQKLLDGTPAPTEKEMQHFLEQYPSMVPGAFNLIGCESGHYPWLCGLISQPILPSFDHRKPDFMWLSLNSATIEPVLIEIEAPNKRWWTESGQQTERLTQALDQILQWKMWFKEPHNLDAFKKMYGLDLATPTKRNFRPSYLLIFGRRAEANVKPGLIAKRSLLAQDDVTVMTYDRLNPNPKAHNLVCMKIKNDRGDYSFKTISVPATFTLKPRLAICRSRLHDLDIAINLNNHISKKRKKFLIQRLPYWNVWLKETGGCGTIKPVDEE
ncbi:Shedu anti-phage system protein SduA domain-containing protein [Methanoregula sp.]|uniref:Shedu anti-phage system protein SduA domain-containing protein n=1 Tax=Methanoregula sp. TaxID=2052170 RepID=UPI00236D79AD|nr:Shedu anti-phage system protein SduA domain-containing protein [Methanoregula sp.]MDD1685582.1 DUF4263 domain-containing protein [Methanoregula sp.]